MTLITMHSRIHFASNILEEALRAEVDDRQAVASVLIYPDELRGSEFLTRVEEGLLSCSVVHHCAISSGQTKYETSVEIAAYAARHPVDLIISMGSAEAVVHGRKCRHVIAKARYDAVARPDRATLRLQEFGPEFFIIPGITGLPDPCLDTTGNHNFKGTPPTVVICDPTVIKQADEQELARAISQTVGRCMTVLTADTFNPLADGLAIDALTRIRRVKRDRGNRDLMAATLNGAIAQQKGPGFVEAFGYSFAKTVGRSLDSALLHRVLLARMLASSKSSNDDVIARVLGLPEDVALSSFVTEFLGDFPLPDTLRDIGMAWDEVSETLKFMKPRFGAPQIGPSVDVRRMLQDVF
ncbi:MAG: iron-containing alcohol dehydrogenase [Pseudomonadota bacterium]